MVGSNCTSKRPGRRHDAHDARGSARWPVLESVVIVTCALAVLWIIRHNSVQLSPVHSYTGNRCETCHASFVLVRFVRFGVRRNVSDKTCLNCHQVPEHQASLQTFVPACASCHVEHGGPLRSRQATDATCVQCHGDLKVRSGRPHYQTAIFDFSTKHPEFAPLRDGYRDPGAIKLNHAVHMKGGLLAPSSGTVQMECQDCHRPPAEQSGPWRYSQAHVVQTTVDTSDPHHPAMPPDPIDPGAGRAYIAAPTYASACQNCHPLQFDSNLPETVPHDRPQVVHAFIVRELTEYIRHHPQSLYESPRPRRPVFAGTVSHEPGIPPIARDAAEWVKLRTAADENLLWHKTCLLCHTRRYNQTDQNGVADLPEVAPSNIKQVWLPDSVFSHYKHVSIDCKSCHTKALSSQETSDVLIPSITTCQTCHNGQPTRSDESQNGCFLCHQYHNWKQRNAPLSPTHRIQERSGPTAPHAPAP
jgi:hypothetical protein